MASCSLAKWTFLFFTVTGQVPDHLLIGINQLYHGGAYAYYSVGRVAQIIFCYMNIVE